MPQLVKKFFFLVFIFCGCVSIGFCLLLLSFSLPVESMRPNIEASARVFTEEGDSPKVYFLGMKSQLDNFTDALMLITATDSSDKNILTRAVMAYRPQFSTESPSKTISLTFSQNKDSVLFRTKQISYPRYWHGYLIVLKPLLLYLNYSWIRIFNTIVVGVLIGIMVLLLYRRELSDYILPYILSLLFIDPIAIGMSMQFMASFCIFSITCIVYLTWNKWFNADLCRLSVLFFITGCATSYFDLLTFPVVTFGMPAIFFVLTYKGSFKNKLNFLVCSGILWVSGYLGMWAAKWLLAALITGNHEIENVLSVLVRRLSMQDEKGISFGLSTLLAKQFKHLISVPFLLIIIYIFVKSRALIKNKIFSIAIFDNRNNILLGLLSLLPFAWFLIASNHSEVHHWMTYRGLLISVFALMCIFTSPDQNLKSSSKPAFRIAPNR